MALKFRVGGQNKKPNFDSNAALDRIESETALNLIEDTPAPEIESWTAKSNARKSRLNTSKYLNPKFDISESEKTLIFKDGYLNWCCPTMRDDQIHFFTDKDDDWDELCNWERILNEISERWGVLQKTEMEHEVAATRKTLGELWEMCSDGNVPPKLLKRITDITMEIQVKDSLLGDILARQDELVINEMKDLAKHHSSELLNDKSNSDSDLPSLLPQGLTIEIDDQPNPNAEVVELRQDLTNMRETLKQLFQLDVNGTDVDIQKRIEKLTLDIGIMDSIISDMEYQDDIEIRTTPKGKVYFEKEYKKYSDNSILLQNIQSATTDKPSVLLSPTKPISESTMNDNSKPENLEVVVSPVQMEIKEVPVPTHVKNDPKIQAVESPKPRPASILMKPSTVTLIPSSKDLIDTTVDSNSIESLLSELHVADGSSSLAKGIARKIRKGVSFADVEQQLDANKPSESTAISDSTPEEPKRGARNKNRNYTLNGSAPIDVALKSYDVTKSPATNQDILSGNHNEIEKPMQLEASKTEIPKRIDVETRQSVSVEPPMAFNRNSRIEAPQSFNRNSFVNPQHISGTALPLPSADHAPPQSFSFSRQSSAFNQSQSTFDHVPPQPFAFSRQSSAFNQSQSMVDPPASFEPFKRAESGIAPTSQPNRYSIGQNPNSHSLNNSSSIPRSETNQNHTNQQSDPHSEQDLQISN
ncbi:hypothetical protein HDV02_001186 [Globomyces sp. JEL0801]|nr:hypothetical protein HDV02_001186 [Globomyces sp. JEL0801]